MDNKQRTILIADDAEINRDLLRMLFENDYNIIEASNGEEAIEALASNKDHIAMLFLDLVMPKKNGLDVLAYMNDTGLISNVPVIMVTGEATGDTDLKAYEYGVSDIIYKPIEPKVVVRRTLNLIELFDYRINIEKELEHRTAELLESRRQLEQNKEFLVDGLSSVVEFRNLESGEHIKMVKQFTKIMLSYLNSHSPKYHFTKSQINSIVVASSLHDLGKIAISDSILLKPAKLTTDEYNEMKKHTLFGCQLLDHFKHDSSDFYTYCYDICRYHHERYDGNGYPDGLSGDEIPIWAQVVSIADVFDALISRRVYKPAFSLEQTIDMIENGECGIFSPEIMDCFRHAKSDLYKLAKEEREHLIYNEAIMRNKI